MNKYIITKNGGHKARDLVGQKFNRLTVIERALNTKSGNAQWKCLCECGNTTVVQSYKLRKGITKSCGCLVVETMKERQSKENSHTIRGNKVVALDASNKQFIFDLDKLELVREHYWYVNKRGYVQRTDGVLLHRFLTKPSDYEVVDHVNHNTTDNRIENLRVCSHTENMRNSRRYSNNTSGRTGVYRYRDKWRVKITVNKKDRHLGVFDTFDEAVKARELAEIKYYKEFTNSKK